jgi:tRNA(Ile)-lysidine synthase
MLQAQDDRTPWVRWEGFEVRRHRGLLYGGAPLVEFSAPETELSWDMRSPLTLPAGLGVLRAEPVRGVGLAVEKFPEPPRVGFRRGGETLQLAGHVHRRDLKKLLQEAGVLPWWRDRVPLLRVGRRLAAVGDLWVGEQFTARGVEPGVRLVWEARPAILAI